MPGTRDWIQTMLCTQLIVEVMNHLRIWVELSGWPTLALLEESNLERVATKDGSCLIQISIRLKGGATKKLLVTRSPSML